MATNRSSDPAAEKDILSTIPGMEDYVDVNDTTGDDAADDPNADVDDQSGRQQPIDDYQQGDDTGEPNKKPQGDDQQQQPQVRYDKQGNVVDARGNIIAPAGRARRLDEQNKRYKLLLDGQTAEMTKLKGQMGEMNFLNGQPQKLGLTNEEVAIGLDLVGMFKNGPQGIEQAVTMVLSEAAARGVDLNKILGKSSAIDTQAISRMLDQRLGPIQRQEQERQRNAAIETEATQRYNSFLASYPDAVHHQDAIAKLMSERGVPEAEAFMMIENFALRNRLDINQPLGPQIEAVMNGGQQQRQQQPNQRPFANGRPVARQVVQRDTKVASPDRTFSSIVDEALAEAGIIH